MTRPLADQIHHMLATPHGAAALSALHLVEAYTAEVMAVPLLTPDEERALVQRLPDPAARAALVEANLRLVVALALRHLWCGLPLADLIQEGNLGLLHAAQKFVPTRGCKFATYATWWICHAMRRGANATAHLVREPEYVETARRQIRRLEDATPGTLTDTMLARRLHLSVRTVRLARRMAPQPERLDQVVLRLPAPYEEPETETRLAFWAVETTMRQCLTPRELAVVRWRFGLDDDELTFDAIGRRLGITRERARQIYESAMTRVRARVNGQAPGGTERSSA